MKMKPTALQPQWLELVEEGQTKRTFELEDFGGLEFHYLSLKDTLPLTKAMQKSQKHLESYLPFFDKKEGKTVPKIQRWIASMLQQQFPSMHFIFTLDGEICGFASTLPMSTDPREVQLRYIVFEGYQGKGLATRMAATLEIMAFQVWGHERVFIEMDSQNRGSVKVAEKLGYSFKATKDMPKLGSDGSGFWYSYVKDRKPNTAPAVLQGKPMSYFGSVPGTSNSDFSEPGD